MKARERILKCLQGQDVGPTPVGSTTAYAMVDLMKKCGAERPHADIDPMAMAKLSLAGSQYAGFEWIKAMGWDISSISQALGCILTEPSIDLPYAVKIHPYAESLNGLDCPVDLLTRGRFPAFKEQFRILREEVGDELAIYGMSEGPFTCAANLVGTEIFMKMTYKDPRKVEQILEVATEAVVQAANFAFRNGADYYCIADPTSAPELMSPKSWDKFMVPVIQEVVKRVEGPIVLHICGRTDKIISMMCQTGVAGISIEEKANMGHAVEIAHQSGVVVFGNVSSATTLFNGTARDCYQEAITALEEGTDFLTPGCGIAPLSPLENVLALRRARDDYFA